MSSESLFFEESALSVVDNWLEGDDTNVLLAKRDGVYPVTPHGGGRACTGEGQERPGAREDRDGARDQGTSVHATVEVWQVEIRMQSAAH